MTTVLTHMYRVRAILALLLFLSSASLWAQSDDATLINITTLAQLDAIRYDLDGDGMVDASASMADSISYETAFSLARKGSITCTGGCSGYELMNNLDFEDADGNGTADDKSIWAEGASGAGVSGAVAEGWAPIGDNSTDSDATRFTATFDGRGYTISNLYINRPSTNNVGLFGVLGSGGNIRNLGIEGGSVTGGKNVGGLVGRNFGTSTISACYATGDASGSSLVGGLVGQNLGGTISACYATGNATGTADNVGGLVGRNSGAISACYATGNASGSSNVGGLVGNNSGTISACYATGDASGLHHVGGLMGFSNGGTISACYATGNARGTGSNVGGLVGTNGSPISACYSTGDASGSSSVGGLVGLNAGTVTNSYFDRNVSNRTDSDSYDKTTTELQTPTAYAGIYANWNIDVDAGLDVGVEDGTIPGDAAADNPWDFGTNLQYPALQVDFNVDGAPSVAEFGTQPRTASPRVSSFTPERGVVGATVTIRGRAFGATATDNTVVFLGAAADADNRSATVSAATTTELTVTVPSGAMTGKISVMVGTVADTSSQDFTVLIGEDKDVNDNGLIEVSSLEQLDAIRYDLDGDGVPSGTNLEQAAYRTAFGVSGAATVVSCTGGCVGYELMNNLDFEDADGDGAADDKSIWAEGAAAAGVPDAVADGWVLISGRFTATFEGNNYTISNLYINRSSADNVGLFRVLGAGGNVRNLGIEGGSVRGRNRVGGLVGENIGGTISDCHATVNVTASRNDVGGLVGENEGGTITNSYATGYVTGSGVTVGGLVGWNNGGAIRASYATGNVRGSGNNVGGLVGANEGGAIRACYATGNSNGAGNVGGFAGANKKKGTTNATISACYVVGNVRGTANNVGGLVGENAATISTCYASGSVAGSSGANPRTGGLVGTNSGTITNSYFDSTVSSVTPIGGGTTTGSDVTNVSGKTTADLQTPTAYGTAMDIYANWNIDVDNGQPIGVDDGTAEGDATADDPWDFGTSGQYPALQVDFDGNGTATADEFGSQRTTHFLSMRYMFDIALGISVGSEVGTVVAVPSDFNNTLSYTISSQTLNGAAVSYFLIANTAIGTISVADPAPTEVGSYTLSVEVSDGVGGTATTEVIINLLLLMSEGEFTACSGKFMDTGGSGNYDENENITMTISPESAADRVRVEFTSFHMDADVDCDYDRLEVYNGATRSAPRIGIYCGTDSPGVVLSSSADGKLTFYFKSDDTYFFSGWEATISCVPAVSVAPAAPTALTAAAGNTAVTLNWTAPASDGGAPITGYMIEYDTDMNFSSPPTTAAAAAAATSYTVSGLTNGTLYYFRVAAVNSAGTGASATAVSATPVASATAPAAPEVSSFTPTSGAVGATVMITGTGFSATAADNTVTFLGEAGAADNAVVMTVSAATATELTVTVPSSAVTGKIQVEVNSVVAVSSDDFTVLMSGPPTDTDDDELINITMLTQLDAIRYDLNGDGTPSGSTAEQTAYRTAFGLTGTNNNTCTGGCSGYELRNNLDFEDADGDGTADDKSIWAEGASGAGVPDAVAEGWVPIGDNSTSSDATRFTATFDGRGHTISNLYINRSTSYVGLFGWLGTGGNLRNLGIEGGSLSGEERVGGLVGFNVSGKISACYATGDATGTGNGVGGLVGRNFGGTISACYATGDASGSSYVGGLVGQNNGTIIACYATGDASGASSVGGLVGFNDSSPSSPGLIKWCYATGNATGTGFDVGGLVGRGGTSTITSSYFDSDTSGIATGTGAKTTTELQMPVAYGTGADIYANWNIDVDDGLAVGVDDGTAAGDPGTDDPWDFGTSSQYPALRVDFNVNGTPTAFEFGGQGRDAATPATVPDAPSALTAAAANAAVTLSWAAPASDGGAPIINYMVEYDTDMNFSSSPTTVSTATAATSHTVSTLTNATPYYFRVAAVNSVGTGAYYPGATDDAVGATPVAPATVPDAPEVSSFTPEMGVVGATVMITGTGFSTTAAENTVIFLGEEANDADNVEAIVSTSPAPTAASLTVTVPADAQTGKISVMVGTAADTSAASFTVSSGPAVLTVSDFTPTSGAVGETVMITGTGFSTTAAENTVTFLGEEANDADNVEAIISTSPAPTAASLTVTVPLDAQTGKISVMVGTAADTSDGSFTVSSGPAILTVSDFTPTSGAVGETVMITGTGFSTTAAENTVTFLGSSSPGDEQTATVNTARATELTVTVPVGAMTGKIQVEVNSVMAVSSDDFTVLTSVPPTDMDADGLIDITTLAQLDAIRYDLDGDGRPTSAGQTAWQTAFSAVAVSDDDAAVRDASTGFTGYELMNSLDFDNVSGSPSIWSENCTDGACQTAAAVDGDNADKVGWAPIGYYNSSTDNAPYTATFEGNSHTISNLYIDRSSANGVGLFGLLGTGSNVRNLGIEGGSVTGQSFVGGLVGWNNGGTISACYATGNATGLGWVGGLVGNNNNGTISACYATGNASGIRFVGGLAGINGSGTISACYATGNALGVIFFVGGLVGSNGGTISACYATGDATGSSDVGGLVGDGSGSSSTVTNSYFDSSVSNRHSSDPYAKTTAQLQTPTAYGTAMDIYANWNIDVDNGQPIGVDDGTEAGDPTADNPWDFGTDMQYPALQVDFDRDGTASVAEFGNQPRTVLFGVFSFTPTSGVVGATVTIRGRLFSATATDNAVVFLGAEGDETDNVMATVSAATASSLTVSVPPAAQTGKISVMVGAAADTSEMSFSVLDPDVLAITGINPTSGPVGETVMITGTGFSTTATENTVTFLGEAGDADNAVVMTVSAATATLLTVSVPPDAKTGKISVMVGTAADTSDASFTVTGTTPAPAAPVVSSFSPTEGEVDTEVTITGVNFSATASANEVRFGGVMAADPTSASTTSLVVLVPSGAVTGRVSVAVGGQTGTSSENFTVEVPAPAPAAPVVSSFSPTEGEVDTEVTITGVNFSDVPSENDLRFGGVMAADPTSASTTSLVVLVPSGAVTGRVSVAVGGQTGTSSEIFTVTVPAPAPAAPVVSSFSPTEGEVDTEVTITGMNFSDVPSENDLRFGGVMAADPTSASTTSLVVLVPSGAVTGRVSVAVGGQTGTSSTDFTVTGTTPAPDPPVVLSFSPSEGVVGTSVTITGENFSATPSENEVGFGGVMAEDPTSASTTSLTILVPSGARTGRVSVTVGGQTGTSSEDFTVTAPAPAPDPPVVLSFSPSEGVVGTSVTITGENFSATPSENEVGFGGVMAEDPTSASTTSLTILVPSGARTGRVSVAVGGQTGTSSTDFTVTAPAPAPEPPVVSSFTPTSGPVGTTVTITGDNFSGMPLENEVGFGGVMAEDPTSASTTSLTVRVPSGARTGSISVAVGGQTGTSSTNFTVTGTTPEPAAFSVPLSSEGDVRLYPNPTSGQLHFKGLLAGGRYVCDLYSLVGQKVLSSVVRAGDTMDTSTLSSAQYILILQAEGRELMRTRLLVVR